MAWETLAAAGIAIAARVTSFDGNAPRQSAEAVATDDGCLALINGAARWRCDLTLGKNGSGCLDGQAAFALESGHEPCGNVSVVLRLDGWSTGNYVLLPAAAYDGNRFRSLPVKYPPFLHEEDGIGPDMPVTITDVPRLNAGDGPSAIHLRSGDLSTPCVGVRTAEGQGILLLFEPITAFGYTGVRVSESEDRSHAEVRIEAPGVRQQCYTMGNTASPSDDRGAEFRPGDAVALRFRVVLFDCPDIPALFRAFLHHRKDLCGAWDLTHDLPLSAAYRIIERKYNDVQFNDQFGYYMLGPNGQGTKFEDWQAGWCGGGLSSFALLADGEPLSHERARSTMDAIFGVLQHPSGFVLPVFSGGKPAGDDYCHPGRTGVLLVRKDADVLLFAARTILLAQSRNEPVPQRWLDGLDRLAQAFVGLWERHGQFGQFIDMDSGDILLGGTASGSMAPGGLILAWRVLGRACLREVAEESARRYYDDFVRRGLLNGGPGEILQCPDSESASNMLESFVALYECTGSAEWLPMAEDTANLCASWCVSYNFTFPASSAFGRLGMKTLGSVYANVQNKHSAPGFCTVSGASLLRLFRATGNRRYLELCRETAHNITQYLSRADRPIPTWDGRELPAGWMCERVNMSDWEGKEDIGGVFRGSCWCEVSCLLTYADIPGVWLWTDTGEAVVFDHVTVAVSDAGDCWLLEVRNSTDFDADVKLLCEPRAAFGRPWDPAGPAGCTLVPVAARRAAVVDVVKAASQQPRHAANRPPDLGYNPQ